MSRKEKSLDELYDKAIGSTRKRRAVHGAEVATVKKRRVRDLSRVKPVRSIERWGEGHYNPHDNVVVRDKFGTHELSMTAGSRDHITIYKSISSDAIHYYVLAENYSLPYIGLNEYTVQRGMTSKVDEDERYEPDDVVKSGDDQSVFLQESEQAEEVLGRKWEDKSALWKIKALRDRIY